LLSKQDTEPKSLSNEGLLRQQEEFKVRTTATTTTTTLAATTFQVKLEQIQPSTTSALLQQNKPIEQVTSLTT
jgi:hypothetical protein